MRLPTNACMALALPHPGHAFSSYPFAVRTMPQRMMVARSIEPKMSRSNTKPMAPMTASAASITSAFKNSLASKMTQPRPQSEAASISAPTTATHARPGIEQHGKQRGIEHDEDRHGVAEPEPKNEHRHPGERGDRHQRAGEWKKEVFDRPEAAHENAERQRDHDRERKPHQHAIHGVARVLQHRAVEGERPQRACDLGQRRQQRRRKGAAARNRLVAGGGDEQREACAVGRRCALGSGRGAHDIIPQRTTVYCSSRWNTSFSSASPMAPMTATPASITSVFKNSRAPKIIQPSPHGTAASISTPTRMRHACARPSRNPVRT